MAPHPDPHRNALLLQRRRAQRQLQRQRHGFWRSLGRDNRVFPRKLVVTRQGRWIIGMAILLGVGAVNTGNNLLYLVLSLLISIIAISGVLSELNLRSLRVRRAAPRELDTDEPTLWRYEVENGKNRASFHIEIDEMTSDDALSQRPGLLLHLQPQETGTCFAVVRAERRGPIATVGLRISTTYPFGFARKSMVVEVPARVLALPAVAEVAVPLQGSRGRGEQERSPKAGQGSELRGLRDFRAGDLARDLHWKVSARRGRLIAREWESEAARQVQVEFIHLAVAPNEGPEQHDAACATVAGVCAALLAAGRAVGLRTLQGEVAAATANDGGQLLQIRRQLGQLTPADLPPPADWPIDDDTWLQRCQAAEAWSARRSGGAAIAASDAFAAQARWAALGGAANANPGGAPLPQFGVEGPALGGQVRVVVRFVQHERLPLAGPQPDLCLWLDDLGAVVRSEQPERALQGAA